MGLFGVGWKLNDKNYEAALLITLGTFPAAFLGSSAWRQLI